MLGIEAVEPVLARPRDDPPLDLGAVGAVECALVDA